mmetsp:Transcript_19275/g.41859  ORF Transcript_19275/g.41859 Transcript_19275/m.41859 type:complete len:244 (+) Transcript_19275:3-734(+)
MAPPPPLHAAHQPGNYNYQAPEHRYKKEEKEGDGFTESQQARIWQDAQEHKNFRKQGLGFEGDGGAPESGVLGKRTSWEAAPAEERTAIVQSGRTARKGEKTEICDLFLEGKCQRGERCFFAHHLAELAQSVVEKDSKESAVEAGGLRETGNAKAAKSQAEELFNRIKHGKKGAEKVWNPGHHLKDVESIAAKPGLTREEARQITFENAELGSDAQKDKFLRLMGTKKPGGSAKPKFGLAARR